MRRKGKDLKTIATEEEIEKCTKNPHYFVTKYLLINGKPFTTRYNETEFNKKFNEIQRKGFK